MIEEERAYDDALKILGEDSNPKKVAMVAMRFRNIAITIHFENLSDCKDAYYMQVCSVFIQRYVIFINIWINYHTIHICYFEYFRYLLEIFFRLVSTLLQENDELKALVSSSKLLRPNQKNKITNPNKLGAPSMSSINSALLDDNIRKFVWEKLNIEEEFPILPDDLLYGVLGQSIHKPDIKALILGKNAPQKFKKFFRCLATTEKINVIEYDEEMAARGEVYISNNIKERFGEDESEYI